MFMATILKYSFFANTLSRKQVKEYKKAPGLFQGLFLLDPGTG